MAAISAAATAFREAYFDADSQDFTGLDDWSDFGARRLRYYVLWAYFQGNTYRDIHSWAKKMRADFGLYKYTRDIYNPAFRLGSFYRSHLWGGQLDALAGDGQKEPSALPIVTKNEALREPIALLWKYSNWKVKRKLPPLYGSTLGDVFLEAVDDTERKKVYIKVVHPGLVKDVMKDPFGNVKGYAIEYQRQDPSDAKKTATYQEIVGRDGENVVYKTFMNGKPFAWDGGEAEWSIPYGFVPMVHIQHFDVGLDWGMSELQPKLALFREVDDQGSKLNDQIRKIVDSPWLFAGLTKPTTTPTTTGAASSTTKPEPGREEVPALYATDPNAKAHALVAPLDIAAVATKIQGDLELLEKNYPELALYHVRTAGDVSGRAIRLIQRDAESKVEDYRDTYDDALVRVQQMALTIGGYREYDGFKGFGLESYANGELDHQIGKRSVFAKDPFDDLELEEKRVQNQRTATQASWPLPAYLTQQNYDEETVAALVASPEWQAKMALIGLNSGMGKGGTDNPDDEQ